MVITGLERHEGVPLDVLEDVAPQFLEAMGLRGSDVAHGVEVAEECADRARPGVPLGRRTVLPTRTNRGAHVSALEAPFPWVQIHG